jgi:hypothetical protein
VGSGTTNTGYQAEMIDIGKAHSQETTGMVVKTSMAVVLRCGRKRETIILSSQLSAAVTNRDVT